MAIEDLTTLVGTWEIAVDLPGAQDARGHVAVELVGNMLVQRATVPDPAPDSCCVILASDSGGFVQHYFDSRGVARVYEMTFDGRTWVLERNKPDLSPLDFHQRYVGELSDDLATITGEWQTSDDGQTWTRDFGLTYRRIG